MHQTFYIDIDEEITSIVDRLRKARADSVIIVVPKRALLIQSIVNLKLLKKEADNLKKDLSIVTQDKLGKMLVEKTGIAVQQKLDDAEDDEELVQLEAKTRNMHVERPAADAYYPSDEKKTRLETMGSSEYFEEAPQSRKSQISVKAEENQLVEKQHLENRDAEIIVNKELITDIGSDMKNKEKGKKVPTFDIAKNIDIRQSGAADFAAAPAVKMGEGKKRPIQPQAENFAAEPEEKFNTFLQNNVRPKYREKTDRPDYGNVHLSGKFWKYILTFGSIGALVAILAAALLFLPKVDIKIFTNTKSQSIDAQVKGDVNQASVDLDAQAIPAKNIAVTDQLTDTFPVTGSASASGQKARGTITIYNEFSSSPQPLVATTRFASPDGKIFRLVKGVSVPGTTNVGGQANPGAIEADVIADEAGDAYNIDPTTFTIPGFKDSGNDKFTKIYAKSFKAMAGGGSDTGTSTAKAISATDITNAKNKTLVDLTAALKQKLKDSAGSGEIILDDATNIGDATYTVSNSAGETVNNFTVTVQAKASGIAFSEKDLRDVLGHDIAKAGAGGQIDENSLVLQYGKSDADFTNGVVTIRVNASGKINPGIDLENLKKGILGKSEDDFKAYLKTYSAIDKVEINYWPPFISGRIPAYASRVSIELDNN